MGQALLPVAAETKSLERHCFWAWSPMQGTETWYRSAYVDCTGKAAMVLLWAERIGSGTTKQIQIPLRTVHISGRNHG